MADEQHTGEQGARTSPNVRRSRWPGWIWAVPIAAAAIVAWLGLRHFVNQGASATLIFDSAPDVQPRNTRVTYLGVKVGEVSDVDLAKDLRHVRVQLSLQRNVEPFLRSGTRFWLEGAGGDLLNLSSLKSAISGPTIVMQPGPGAPQTHFHGLDQPPAYQQPVTGQHYTLLAKERGGVGKGSDVYYLGLKVGKVTDLHFDPPDHFRFDTFIRTPYNALVHPGTRFWNQSALRVSISDGLGVQLVSPGALLSGAVSFETTAAAAANPPSKPGDRFTLYPDHDSADKAPQGGTALFAIDFSDDVGNLAVGAPVKLRGFTVGTVRSVDLHFDAASGTLQTPVTIELDGERLHLGEGAAQLAGGWTPLLDGVVSRLVTKGLRAHLRQQPPLVGSAYVSLAFASNAPPATLDLGSSPPRIPAEAGGGLGGFTDRLGQLPLDQIGDNVRAITSHVRTLVASPKVQDSLAHLDDTLAHVDQIVTQATPQVPQLIASLRRTAEELDRTAAEARQTIGGPQQQGGLNEAVQELTRAARSVRALADYLDRHPEAVLHGKPQ